MEDTETFIDSEFLDEEVVADQNPASAHHLARGPTATDKRPGARKDVHENDDDEYEEEEIHGQIIQGEDGEFYVLMEDDGVENVEIDDNPSSVRFLINPDGEHQIIFQSVPSDPHSSEKRIRPARAILQETENGQVEMIQFTDVPEDEEGGTQMDLAVGAIQTAEAADDHMMHHGMLQEPMPQGIKLRRTRVYGSCRCQECGQTFVNTARLERHLAVHQVFGSFLCPLCGKTYKYEYNLFYHWRRTCRDLNELMSYDDRKTMDVNALRSLVDEVAAKKQEYGPIEIGISRSVLFQSGPLARLEMPANPLGRRGTNCRACGVVVHLVHLQQHLNLHKGTPGVEPDQRSAVGGFYCDLCGLLFRQHFNLIKHWRTNCAEIQANMPEHELTMDDGGLRDMVRELLRKASTNEAILEAESQRLKQTGPDGRRLPGGDGGDYDVPDDELPEARRERERDEAEAIDRQGAFHEGREIRDAARDFTDDEPGAVFADDFEDDEVHMLGEEAIGAGGTIANRAKWHMGGGPVQCQECFRSFANHGRLERHMAGFHASHGSHHCALCGNRFKYDYNLLYHYRKSCPYTKQLIERDVRDQMDAASLRKLVRTLAQKDIRLNPVTHPMPRLPKPPTQQSNDAAIRREMIRPILASAPAVLTQARRGMQGVAKQCPICSIMFYQDSAIQRHMSMRHGMEYGADDFDDDDLYEAELQHRRGALKAAAKKEAAAAAADEERDEDEIEPMPSLEAQPPGEQPSLMPKDDRRERARFASQSLHDHSLQQHLQQQPHHHHQQHQQHHHPQQLPTQMRDVQEMYERGELQDGDRIIIQEDGREVEYTVNDNGGEATLDPQDDDDERDEEVEDDDTYDTETPKMRAEQQMAMSSRGGARQHQQQQMRRFPAGRDQQQLQQQRPSTSQQQLMVARKRPREEEASMWDDDLLEDDEELEELQREVDRRRQESRTGTSAPGRRQMPSIMQRRP